MKTDKEFTSKYCFCGPYFKERGLTAPGCACGVLEMAVADLRKEISDELAKEADNFNAAAKKSDATKKVWASAFHRAMELVK